MPLILAGINHRTAPVELRERLNVSTSVEDTSSSIQFQLPTLAFDIVGQASATGTSVDTFAELTINLLIPTTGSFHFVATGETAVEG